MAKLSAWRDAGCGIRIEHVTPSSSIGKCALCLNTCELLDSHFLPKGLYRLVRAHTSRNPHPVRLTSSGQQRTAFQASSRLLCSECEQRFDRNGENWVLKHCYRGRGVFRFRELVENAAPLESESEFAIYSAASAPSIDISKVVYFCASVFWRASAQDWQIEGHSYASISLGSRYQEEIRQYLLGASAFPENATLMVLLSKLRIPILTFNFPDSVRGEYGWCHRLHVPGMSFMLTLGKQAHKSRMACILRSPWHPIFVAAYGDMRVQRDMLKLMGKAAPCWAEYPLVDGFEGPPKEY